VAVEAAGRSLAAQPPVERTPPSASRSRVDPDGRCPLLRRLQGSTRRSTGRPSTRSSRPCSSMHRGRRQVRTCSQELFDLFDFLPLELLGACWSTGNSRNELAAEHEPLVSRPTEARHHAFDLPVSERVDGREMHPRQSVHHHPAMPARTASSSKDSPKTTRQARYISSSPLTRHL
jgi:hypothetical protein